MLAFGFVHVPQIHVYENTQLLRDSSADLCIVHAYTHTQPHQILEALNKDLKYPVTTLRVDEKMATSNRLLKLQANLLGIPVGMAPAHV